MLQVAYGGGRPLRPITCLIFGVSNGIFETRAFAASFDLGRVVASRTMKGSFADNTANVSIAGFIVGNISMMVFSGLIHALFWDKYVLPPHISKQPSKAKSSAKKINSTSALGARKKGGVSKHMILSLTVTSVAWMLCYQIMKQIWPVVFLHSVVDVGVGIATRIQPPFLIF